MRQFRTCAESVDGRGTRAGYPGAPSISAVAAALRFGLPIVGFVRNARFRIYSGEARILPME